MSKLVCNKCGRDNIRVLAWISPNTKLYICDDEESDNFCDDCDNYVKFITLDKFHIEFNDRTWKEQGDENQYFNKCIECKKLFSGHKRRMICRLCYNK